MKKKQMVVVTTNYRGVFYGELASDVTPERVVLKNCRNCLRWGDAKGFLGLAAYGPGIGHRVGPAAPSITLHGITSVIECTPQAVEAWSKASW